MKLTLAKELVAERGWNVQDLANRAGLDAEAAQCLAEGTPVEIDLPTLSRLSEVLGVLPNELVAEVEEPETSIADEMQDIPAISADNPTYTIPTKRGIPAEGTVISREPYWAQQTPEERPPAYGGKEGTATLTPGHSDPTPESADPEYSKPNIELTREIPTDRASATPEIEDDALGPRGGVVE
jgi:DNA-binding Xre family transcriptional regulator